MVKHRTSGLHQCGCRLYKSWASASKGGGATLYMVWVEQPGQPAEEEISEVVGSNPTPHLYTFEVLRSYAGD